MSALYATRDHGTHDAARDRLAAALARLLASAWRASLDVDADAAQPTSRQRPHEVVGLEIGQ